MVGVCTQLEAGMLPHPGSESRMCKCTEAPRGTGRYLAGGCDGAMRCDMGYRGTLSAKDGPSLSSSSLTTRLRA